MGKIESTLEWWKKSVVYQIYPRSFYRPNIVVIEGLQMKAVVAGIYFMVAAPLKLIGTDAAPARVILIEDMKG